MRTPRKIELVAYFQKHFTLAEAQGRIPWVRTIFVKIHLILRAHAHAQPSPAGNHNGGNGHKKSSGAETPGADPTVLVAELDSAEKRELVKSMVQAIANEGIIIQDLERGLIDFPTWKEEREVLFCYELDDGDRIGFWHEVDAGYLGRAEIHPGDF